MWEKITQEGCDPWEAARGPREVECAASAFSPDTRVLARGQGALPGTEAGRRSGKWVGEGSSHLEDCLLVLFSLFFFQDRVSL